MDRVILSLTWMEIQCGAQKRTFDSFAAWELAETPLCRWGCTAQEWEEACQKQGSLMTGSRCSLWQAFLRPPRIFQWIFLQELLIFSCSNPFAEVGIAQTDVTMVAELLSNPYWQGWGKRAGHLLSINSSFPLSSWGSEVFKTLPQVSFVNPP